MYENDLKAVLLVSDMHKQENFEKLYRMYIKGKRRSRERYFRRKKVRKAVQIMCQLIGGGVAVYGLFWLVAMCTLCS